MNKDPAKDFGAIADDYVFFETHATEAQADAREYGKQLRGIVLAGKSVRMLDFGCGSGNFTVRFLEQAGWPPERLSLTLVEPIESVRRQAVDRCRGFSNAAVADSSALPAERVGCFDVVLANHVFYYVPDLLKTLNRLVGTLAQGGIFLTAIAGRNNALIQFWITGFGLLGREIPYNTSEDVAADLRELGVIFAKQRVPYELTFPDTEENRMRMIRFLLAEHLAEMPHRPLVDLFDQYSHAGRIVIQTASDHYTLRQGPAKS